MRKIAAILLLVILLFNWIGYSLITDFLQYRSDIKLEARLDKNDYREDQLIEIKIPLHLPYQLNWREFERFDGEIDVDGKHYKYVKRRVFNDSLVLLCLPNENREKLEKAKDDYFKIVNDVAPSSQKKSDNKNLSFKSILSEFFVAQPFRLNKSFNCLETKYFIVHTSLPLTNFTNIPVQPPEC